MIVPVLNAGYCQIGISLFTAHDQYMPPPPPAPPLPAIPGILEGAALGWPVASFLHKKAPTVLVDGNPGIQQGHDIGYGIPHYAAPPNALMAVHILLSKHKVMFPVSSVLLEGKPVGTYVFGHFGGLICANPISLPTGALIKIKGTVETSATLGDILRGLAYILLDQILDLLWNKVKGANAFKWVSEKTSRLLDPLKAFLGKAWVSFGKLLFLDLYHGLPKLWDKLVQHVLKSWIASPALGGLPRGTTGVGRGKASGGWKPFGKELW